MVRFALEKGEKLDSLFVFFFRFSLLDSGREKKEIDEAKEK